jgi:SAM-dependent methyltransferase
MQLNIGCGHNKMVGEGWVNVDAYANCKPDIVHDLNVAPWPFPDNSVDLIYARHVFEHLQNWWVALEECARILKPGGVLDMRVPHDSSSSAMGYRDHFHIFTPDSFHGTIGRKHGTNAWAEDCLDSIPLQMISFSLHPFEKYKWMIKWCPRVLAFCAEHLRNFIWEQQFKFVKVGKK